MKSYFNLIEPNSVFTAFGLMTPNRGTTEDDFFSALIFSSYYEVNTVGSPCRYAFSSSVNLSVSLS